MVARIAVMKVTYRRYLVAVESDLDVKESCCLVLRPCGKNGSWPSSRQLPFFVYEAPDECRLLPCSTVVASNLYPFWRSAIKSG